MALFLLTSLLVVKALLAFEPLSVFVVQELQILPDFSLGEYVLVSPLFL